MSRVYDNWERLVEATLDREKLRELAFCESLLSSTSTDFSSRFSFDSLDINASCSRMIPTFTVHLLKFDEIKEATRNFCAELVLGRGGFGTVFKGWIHESSLTAAKPGAGMAVAVKKSSSCSVQVHEEWLAEINYLSQLHHPNLIKLIGHCSQEDNLILVYEFIPRGSLCMHLFYNGLRPLSWATRIKVAIGAGRALSFLHDREKQVIHQGVHSSIILLDAEFNTKLSDFGWATYGPSDDMTHISPRVKGRVCYVSPEYMATGHVTEKCDVYGFGVILLELLSGRHVIDKTKAAMEQNLVDWTKECMFGRGKLVCVMDIKLEGQYPQKEAYRVAALALKCLNHDSRKRPKMSEVVVELEKL